MRAFARASPFPGVKNQLALRGLNEPLDGPLSSIGTLHSEESPSQFGPGVPLKRRGGVNRRHVPQCCFRAPPCELQCARKCDVSTPIRGK